ncbi:hypothetical protein D3C84_984280 [compost metagenome]
MQLALTNVAGAAQSQKGPFRTFDQGLKVGEVQKVGTVEVDVRAGRKIKHTRLG